MNGTAVGQYLQEGIPGLRFDRLAAGDGGIKGGQVMTVEVADEIGSTEAGRQHRRLGSKFFEARILCGEGPATMAQPMSNIISSLRIHTSDVEV